MNVAKIDKLHEFIRYYPRLVVLTGAGISTASGIPDYRDAKGEWKLQQPMTFTEFTRSHHARQRYWARSALGWPLFDSAQPNGAHHALAALERLGYIKMLITQNVDRLHQCAGHEKTIDLHGRLDEVICLNCGEILPRQQLQQALIRANPSLAEIKTSFAPDGDAQLEHFDFNSMVIPECTQCEGVLKPNVVFFGENVPRSRVSSGLQALDRAEALLVIGSSLQVFSGYRFVRSAFEQNKPVISINLGSTRADHLFKFQVKEYCGPILKALASRIMGQTANSR